MLDTLGAIQSASCGHHWMFRFASLQYNRWRDCFIEGITSLESGIHILKPEVRSEGLRTDRAAIVTEGVDALEWESAARRLLLWFRKQGVVVAIHVKKVLFVSLWNRCYLRWMDHNSWGIIIEILGEILNFFILTLRDLMRLMRTWKRRRKGLIVVVVSLRWDTAAAYALFTTYLSNKALNNLIVIALNLMFHLDSFEDAVYEIKCGFIGLLLHVLFITTSPNDRFFGCFGHL